MKFKSNATINLFLMSGYRIIAKNKQSARNKKPQSKRCYFEVSYSIYLNTQIFTQFQLQIFLSGVVLFSGSPTSHSLHRDNR